MAVRDVLAGCGEEPRECVLRKFVEAPPSRQEGFRDEILNVVGGGPSGDISSNAVHMVFGAI
jgi:hypothetical protein